MQFFEFISSIGPTVTAYCAALIANALIASFSGDWRLRWVAGLFFALWLITNVFPYTEILASPASFLALSLIQIRRQGESELSWWLVPVIVAEVGIFLSHLALPTVGYRSYWLLVQFFFAVQLVVTITVGLSRARKRDAQRRRARTQAPDRCAPTIVSARQSRPDERAVLLSS